MLKRFPPFISLATFRAEATEWKHFARVVLLVLGLSLTVVAVACEFLCWKTGELLSDEDSTKRQTAEPSLIWFAHHEVDAVHFKMLRVNQLRPEILIMGQSRAAQFRAAMFEPYSCYNLGRVSWPLSTLSLILQHLPAGYNPRVIVFNLDYYLFSPRYETSHRNAAPRFDVPFWKKHLDSLRDALTDLNDNPSILFSTTSQTTIGLQAYFTHHGFRQDGSEVWPSRMEAAAGRDPQMLDRTQWREDPLDSGGDSMDPSEEADLKKFADLAKARGIKLIGIQMPMYRPVVDVLERSPYYRFLLGDFRAHLADGYFDRLGIITFDYLDFPPYSSDYRYFADSVHPTEVVCAAILLKIYQDPRVQALLPRLNTVNLANKLNEDQKSDLHVHLY